MSSTVSTDQNYQPPRRSGITSEGAVVTPDSNALSDIAGFTSAEYDDMRSALEADPGNHNSIHTMIGSSWYANSMGGGGSANDIVFAMHHATVDAHWKHWQDTTTGGIDAYDGTPFNTMIGTDIWDAAGTGATPWDTRNSEEIWWQGDCFNVKYSSHHQPCSFGWTTPP